MSIVSVLPYSPSYVHSGVFDCSVMETWTTNDKEDKREARKEPQDDLNAAGTAVTRRTVRNELQSSPFLHLALFKRYPLIGGNGNKTKKQQPSGDHSAGRVWRKKVLSEELGSRSEARGWQHHDMGLLLGKRSLLGHYTSSEDTWIERCTSEWYVAIEATTRWSAFIINKSDPSELRFQPHTHTPAR